MPAMCLHRPYSSLREYMKDILTGVLLALLIAAMLGSCGLMDRNTSALTGNPSKVCVEGVTYLQFTSGVSVMVDKTGKPVIC